MRVLFDESLPRAFARDVASTGHETWTVAQMGWAGTQNGAFLRLAVAEGFRAFVTADRNIEYQQNVRSFEIGVIVVITPSNRSKDLRHLVPHVGCALLRVRLGTVSHVGASEIEEHDG